MIKSPSFSREEFMAEMLDQAPAMERGLNPAGTALPKPTVAYDGQNAQVQQQRSAQSEAAKMAAARGARWFFWIAGLSAINTITALAGGNFHFVLGLGITQLTGAFPDPQARAVGFIVDFLVLGFFLMCGYFAAKLHKWAFAMGMAVYFLDAGILLLAKDWIGLAFHVYALVWIWKGFSLVNAARATNEAAILSAT